MSARKKSPPHSAKASALAARLMAVQAVHQNFHNAKSASELAQEFLSCRAGMQIEDEIMLAPDEALFREIITGVDSRAGELHDLIKAAYSGAAKDKVPEALLRAIILCGAYEILAHPHIESPIVINDYLNVTHGFFGKGEAGMINAVLDSLSKSIRKDA